MQYTAYLFIDTFVIQILLSLVSLSMQAQAQTQLLHAQGSNFVSFSRVCAAATENEIPLRHNTSTKIFTTRGYV